MRWLCWRKRFPQSLHGYGRDSMCMHPCWSRVDFCLNSWWKVYVKVVKSISFTHLLTYWALDEKRHPGEFGDPERGVCDPFGIFEVGRVVRRIR